MSFEHNASLGLRGSGGKHFSRCPPYMHSGRGASPPKRLPSRRATSHGETGPKVPAHRAYGSDSRSPLSTRFRVPPISPFTPPSQLQQQEQKLLEAEEPQGKNDWSGSQELLGKSGLSPLPKLPNHAAPAQSRQLGEFLAEPDGEHGPNCHSYRADDDDKRDLSPAKLVEISISNSVIVTGVVDVAPCRWRLRANPSPYPMRLHIREMDANTYPMHRLFRLIQKTVAHGEDGGEDKNLRSQQPMEGSLYIYKEDNPHLQFAYGLPNIIFLSGSMVLADVVSVDQLPLHGVAVKFRWIEAFSRRYHVDDNSSPLVGDLTKDNSAGSAAQNYVPFLIYSSSRILQGLSGSDYLHCENNGAKGSNSSEKWRFRKNDYRPLLSSEERNASSPYSPPVNTVTREGALNLLHVSVVSRAADASPITYLHTPCTR
ncbi:hypothetical protein Tc00.1047053506503.53 [Trypanosoma cruzi]|uniref:Uncharacterized protein n=1 Tax=Trypanosoma cruzi (strain CL Brener) TaxID=353153 RepID=Q4DRE1_TRYCC|nr:hypothetical protein Tc00.1047053506503.53 [Trypanosoma cruzi]EAN95094.1 hypothetical protein Tc00.1047053506503.53 [Trypanosoma cruzi]|eukprot:XP_816945.1 hypothetical protein [Trypanosoma cruzi strain CL Brener]